MIKSDFAENKHQGSPLLPSEELHQKKNNMKNESTKCSKQKTRSLESFNQLVQLVYNNAFKRSKFTPSEVKALRITCFINASKRQEMLELAKKDTLLEKTRQLMLLALRTDDIVARHVADFSCDVLRQHFFFQNESLLNAIESADEHAFEVGIIDTIIERNIKDLDLKDCETCLKDDSFKIMKINAAHCLILYLAINKISLMKIHSLFQRLICPKRTPASYSINEQVYTLITTRAPEAAAVTSRLLEAQLADQARLISEAVADKRYVEIRAKTLEGKVYELEKDLERCENEISLLKKTAEQATKNHNSERACWRDDYEQLRGNVLRRMKQEVALLDEGLHALRKDPPKIHVMIDHAERAIDGLKLGMKQILEDD